MLTYPTMSPVAFHIFSWPVYWYGLMYLISFIAGWAILSLRARASWRGFTQDQVSDIAFYTALGVIIGGRLGYILFYDGQTLFTNPLLVFQTWKGGMSFHGGLLGVLLAMFIFAKKTNKRFLELTDFIAPVVPVGLAAGRIGNFINGELWGRVTDSSFGMIFPNAGDFPRHPSQLYEFSMEGILLFAILFLFSSKSRPLGAVSGLFALFYGIFRCTAEFFRQPDSQIGYLFGGMTEGQLLSIPLIVVGIMLLVFAYKRERQRL
jgi:phosphatidylglycerol:prolipoprotein diacylglycerol transferase